MRKLVLVPLLLFTVACSDNMPVEPEMTVEISAAKAAQNDLGGPWAASITGSGHFEANSYYAPGPVWRTFTINAKKARDGRVDGRFQVTLHLKDGVHIAKGEVVCFAIEGNMAWIGAHKDGNDPPDIAFQVADNGEGSGGVPDEVGLYAEAAYWGFPAGLAEGFCDEKPEMMELPGTGVVPLAMFRHPIEAGNIQIKTR
jgi:hypothetical protein